MKSPYVLCNYFVEEDSSFLEITQLSLKLARVEPFIDLSKILFFKNSSPYILEYLKRSYK